MRDKFRWQVLGLMLALAALGAVAPSASASITPTVSLDQSAGETAGSTASLGVDIAFAPTGTDSPDLMTLDLPPGLLANASINGGGCLTSADLTDAACQVGSGTVNAKLLGYIPISTPVTFDLVPPPAAGDLAGLAVNSNGTQIGSTADVRVRPSGDPGGVGISIGFTLPNSLYGQSLSITEISSTFDALRYPTTCPSTPQSFSITANSYDDSTAHTASAPLAVTGCSGLSYAPAFSASAARDSADESVKVSTEITQTAEQSPSRSVTLQFSNSVLQPNIAAVKLLCPTVSSSCTPVGSVTAQSPLYPKPLTGAAYLTGSFPGLALTLAFPPPFPLTLSGTIDLSKNATAFTGLPDIPLTDLQVSLNGGPNALFKTMCTATSGTASAALTDQNNDKNATVSKPFSLAGCPVHSGGGTPTTTGPTISRPSLSGLKSGHIALRFTIAAARGDAKLAALAVGLPRGLRFTRKLHGVRLSGARIKSLRLSGGRLLITLRHASARMTVTVPASALVESAALQRKPPRRVRLLVIATDARHHRFTIHTTVRPAKT